MKDKKLREILEVHTSVYGQLRVKTLEALENKIDALARELGFELWNDYPSGLARIEKIKK